MGWGLSMHKCVMHFLGHNCLNNHIHVSYISPKFLAVIKLHVFTSRNENSEGPDQVGSWLICILQCFEEKKINPGSA